MKKLLWHKKTEEPKCEEGDVVSLLIVSKFGINQDIWCPEWTWSVFCIENKIDKWCYEKELRRDDVFLDNEEEKKIQFEGKDIEFVKYTGEFPNLCTGTLFVRIDGQKFIFGDSYWATHKTKDLDGVAVYPSFWESAGSFDDNWNAIQKPWKLVPKKEQKLFPEEIRKLLPTLIKVFNKNVPHGCCGGCA